MKGIRGTLIAIIALALLFFLPGSGFAAEKSLADILKEKGILTEEEYQQVKELEESQKAGEAKKAEEATKQAEEATKQAEEATKQAEEATKKAEELAKKAAAEKPAPVVAGYKKGFFIQTPDEKYKLVFNGYVRGMLELYENNTSQDNQFDINRARLNLKGYYGKYWMGEVSAELTTASDSRFLKYAYINNSYLPYLQARVGQFKAPFSREYLITLADVETIMRAMITDAGGTLPKYDIGAMLWSPNVFNGLLWYGAGIFNGNGANNFDSNDDMDFIGRLVVAPFAPTQISALKGLEFGGSVQTGRQTPNQSYSPRLPTNWSLFGNNKTSFSYRGQRDRYALEASYKWGPLTLRGEWIYQRLERENQVRVDPTTNAISSSGELMDAPDLISWGWYVLGSYFVWGNQDKGIQLVARYEQFDVDDDPAAEKYRKANPMAENSVTNPWGNDLNIRGNTADVLTLGINYFPYPNVRLAFNWFYQTLDNTYTTDKIKHNNDGGEFFTGGGGAMNSFWLMAQVKW